MPFLIAVLPITLDKVIVLCTRVTRELQVSLLTTVNVFLGFGCEAFLLVVWSISRSLNPQILH